MIKIVGVAPQKPRLLDPFWRNVIRGWDWTKTDVQPRPIIRYQSTMAQMMRFPTRYEFIWNEAPQLHWRVHRPPKTAKFGGQRYSEKINKWAKINILQFTQYPYQTIAFDIWEQDHK